MDFSEFFYVPTHAIFMSIIIGVPLLILYTRQCKKDYEGYEVWDWMDWIFIWATPIAALILLIVTAANSFLGAIALACAISLLCLLAPSQVWKLRMHQFLLFGLLLSVYYIRVFWW